MSIFIYTLYVCVCVFVPTFLCQAGEWIGGLISPQVLDRVMNKAWFEISVMFGLLDGRGSNTKC